MKKIVCTIMAAAALAACTKSEVNYEAPAEIGFNVVAGNITKAVVDGTTYPTGLDMYVYAQTTDNTSKDANYIKDGLFKYKNQVDGTNVWGGNPTSYYWPNVKTLHFAGYSASGNVGVTDGATVAYDCSASPETLTITNYSPVSTNNDLMWFPTTELKVAAGYGKATKYVPVDMYHTCSWITFLVKGDNVTGANGSTYKVTAIKMTDVDQIATVVCSATATTADGTTDVTVTPSIVWSNNDDKTNTEYSVSVKNSSVTLTQEAKDVETDAAYAAANGTTSSNVVVIPQTPGKLELTYTYESSTGTIITESYTGEKALSLALAKDASNTEGPTQWEPGKHYIYTITIKANEILVAPKPVDWTDGNFNVTVE